MARSTMSSLIELTRALASSGSADYTIGVTPYWSDDQIQAALDRNRLDVVDEQLSKTREVSSAGIVEWRLYQSQHRYLESTDSGTAIFYLRDSTGTRAGTADYTQNYESGAITFNATTEGTAYYLTARSYDVYSAAAEIWRMKASHVADRFDFSADGASFKASQLVNQYERMASTLEKKATHGNSSARAITMFRDDVSQWHPY